jgi:hypothetical protein
MLTLVNWLGNLAMALAFLSVLGVAASGTGPTLAPATLHPVDPKVTQTVREYVGKPGPSVRPYSPPRPRRTYSTSYSGSRSFGGGGGFRSGK